MKDCRSQQAGRYPLRFHEDGMRDRIKKIAESNKRSMNSELLYLVQRGLEAMYDQPSQRSA